MSDHLSDHATPDGRVLTPVESLDDVPSFANEDEEHEFWSTHSFGERLLDQFGTLDDPALPKPRRRTVAPPAHPLD